MRNIIKAVLAPVLAGLIVFPAAADPGSAIERTSLGLGYPYISVRNALTPRVSVEGRFAFSDEIQIYGARGYYTLRQVERLSLLSGLEVDFVSFKTGSVSGYGLIAYPFLGGEYRVAERISLLMDFGPAFIHLKENDFSLTLDGLEWVVNLGVYYHFR